MTSTRRDSPSRPDGAEELRVISGGAAEPERPPAGDTPGDDEMETKRSQDRARPGQEKDGSSPSKSDVGKKHTNNLRKLRIERMMTGDCAGACAGEQGHFIAAGIGARAAWLESAAGRQFQERRRGAWDLLQVAAGRRYRGNRV